MMMDHAQRAASEMLSMVIQKFGFKSNYVNLTLFFVKTIWLKTESMGIIPNIIIHGIIQYIATAVLSRLIRMLGAS